MENGIWIKGSTKIEVGLRLCLSLFCRVKYSPSWVGSGGNKAQLSSNKVKGRARLATETCTLKLGKPRKNATFDGTHIEQKTTPN